MYQSSVTSFCLYYAYLPCHLMSDRKRAPRSFPDIQVIVCATAQAGPLMSCCCSRIACRLYGWSLPLSAEGVSLPSIGVVSSVVFSSGTGGSSAVVFSASGGASSVVRRSPPPVSNGSSALSCSVLLPLSCSLGGAVEFVSDGVSSAFWTTVICTSSIAR